MSSTTRGAVLALLVTAPLLGQGQQASSWPQPGQLVREGIILHDKNDYAGAIAKYRAVTPGDSAYAWAQGELALSLLADKQLAEAATVARRAITLNPFEPSVYVTLGDVQDEQKQPEAAIKTYDEALKLFPYFQSLHFNKAVTQLNHGQPAVALATFQRSLELKPTHLSSHRLLGLLAAEQGQTARTLISWLTFLFIADASSEASHTVLVHSEQLAMGQSIIDEKDRLKPFVPNDAFAELDQLLDSKVALQKSYASKVSFPAALVKQTQLLVEKFPVDGPADDFWVRAYGPLVKVLRQGDNLTTFTYMVLASASDDKPRKWLKSNQSKVTKLAEALVPALNTLRELQPVAGAPAGPRQPAWFKNDGTLSVIGQGQRDASGQVQLQGPCISVESNGAIDATGSFKADKQVGEWKVLRPDGTLKKVIGYNEQGERTSLREFYPGGQLKVEEPYRAGKLDGTVNLYNECGLRTEVRTLKAGDFEGPYTTYYPTGQVQYRTTSRADQPDGLVEEFYPNGSPQSTTTYANGKRQGLQTFYYRDKTIERKVEFDQGERHGLYTDYHANGQVRETGRYEHDKRVGEWHSFFRNGKPDTDARYEAGELQGPYVDYDEQGRRFASTEYVRGRVTRLQYLDAAGKVLLDEPVKKGRVAVRALGPEGKQIATGSFVDGQIDGEWKWYYRDGSLREVSHFSKGEKLGLSETYFADGQLRQRKYFGPGEKEEGSYERYYADGVLAQRGHYLGGEAHGPWEDYYANGKLSEEYELHRGARNGPSRSYAAGGKLSEERLYEFGTLRQSTEYDSTGQVLDQIKYPFKTSELSRHYANGKTMFRTGALCNDFSGPASWLFPDGSPEVSLSYLDGQRNGPYKSFFRTGKPNQAGQYLHGQRVGEWNIYYPAGQLRAKGRYRDDEEDGEWTYYYPNGQVAEVETYQAGERHGPARYYNPVGELLVEKNYAHGTVVGYRGPGPATAPFQALPETGGAVAVSFTNGKPAARETYAHEDLSGTATYYYASGEVFQRVNYVHGLLSGPLESFYPNGKPLAQESFLHGVRHGRCRYYRPDGTLEREETYLSGEHNGPLTYYDAAGKPQRSDQYWNESIVVAKSAK